MGYIVYLSCEKALSICPSLDQHHSIKSLQAGRNIASPILYRQRGLRYSNPPTFLSGLLWVVNVRSKTCHLEAAVVLHEFFLLGKTNFPSRSRQRNETDEDNPSTVLRKGCLRVQVRNK